MEITAEMTNIANYVKRAIQGSLEIVRPSTAYDGRLKPLSGRYPTPRSKNIATGTLYNSINVYWEEDYESPVPNMVVEMEDYGYWIDNGRKPTANYSENKTKEGIRYTGLVPFEDIRRWLANKPGVMPGLPEDTKVFLISRSIARDGYGAKNFIDDAIRIILPTLESDDGPIAESVVKYINDLFDEGKLFPRTTFNTP